MVDTNIELESYQQKLIEISLASGALKFGEFELKSGRISPYFFLATELNTGKTLNILATAYATYISSALTTGAIPPFDVIFGPAYKGIPLAASVALLLHRDYGINVGWAYDRKEAKSHGEGGILVGASVRDNRVLVLDDVITAGTAIGIALGNIENAGGKIVGVIICLDREEIGGGENAVGTRTVDQVASKIGGPVKALLRMRDLMTWLSFEGREEDLEKMKLYWERYGAR
ncbi:hypothetical protein Clacol_002666 [Clathrus columnatus]|uniref:orotate phosphoribosyltransferase n=1 Tax=Clathrus columnatus TaxID=1419009 RepID=A0AAV5A4Q1_9AGAM|nr:hypothetical protein Clacol_002666 [Clathrus columnatus]